jgi:myo-inositol-1-phosphate synthase
MANKKVRVAIIGVGNCASSLVQGVYYYHLLLQDAAQTVQGQRLFRDDGSLYQGR